MANETSRGVSKSASVYLARTMMATFSSDIRPFIAIVLRPLASGGYRPYTWVTVTFRLMRSGCNRMDLWSTKSRSLVVRVS